MNLRAAVLTFSLVLIILTAPLAAEARAGSEPVKIGVLTPQSQEVSASRWEAFRQGLRDLGWENGRNIIIEARFADGNLDRLRPLAEELVKLGVSVIVAANTPRAAMDATTSIPIVMVEVVDPVATGFVKSLGRPRGNVTGVSTMARDITRKRLEEGGRTTSVTDRCDNES